MSLSKLIEQIDHKKRINPSGIRNIAKTIKGEKVDNLSIIFWRPTNASVPGEKNNFKDQFFDKEKMLFAHLKEIEKVCADTYDAALCVRPNFGTIFIPAMFGLNYKVFNDRYPWLTEHLPKYAVDKADISHILSHEMMERAIGYIEYFKSVLPKYIHVYMPDTQGPFDLAHLIYGDDIFYEMYDNPQFVHELMEVCTQVYIAVSKNLKKSLGERDNECFHGHALARGIYMNSGGVRISEDSATLISPEQIDEFVIPYVEKALEPFGGGFIHYCGKSVPLLDAFLNLEKVRAINFGNPEMYDFESTMKKFIEKGKCCYGQWPKRNNETINEYLLRMKNASENGTKGLLLHLDDRIFPDYEPEEILKMFAERVGTDEA